MIGHNRYVRVIQRIDYTIQPTLWIINRFVLSQRTIMLVNKRFCARVLSLALTSPVLVVCHPLGAAIYPNKGQYTFHL